MTRVPEGLLDTSVLIAGETGRAVDTDRLPDQFSLSVVTIGELYAGVHAARDVETRARRIETLSDLADVEILDIDERVGLRWAKLCALLAEARRRVNVNDLWIAATALRYEIPVVTQDADFDPLDGLAGLAVIRV